MLPRTLFSLKHPRCSSNMFCVSQAHISSISHFSNDFPPDIKSENSTFTKHYNSNTRKVRKHPDNIYFKLFYLHFIDRAMVTVA